MLAEVFKHSETVLVAETDFSLFDTQGTRLEIMPKVEIIQKDPAQIHKFMRLKQPMTQPKIFLFLAIALIAGLFVVRGCNPDSGVGTTDTHFNPGKPILSPAGLAGGVQQWKVENLFEDKQSAAYGYAILKWSDGTELRCSEGDMFVSPNVCEVWMHYRRHLQKTDTTLKVADAATVDSIRLKAPVNCKQTAKLSSIKFWSQSCKILSVSPCLTQPSRESTLLWETNH